MDLKDYRKYYFHPLEDITVYELALISRVHGALTGAIREGLIPEGCERHFRLAGNIYEAKITLDNQS